MRQPEKKKYLVFAYTFVHQFKLGNISSLKDNRIFIYPATDDVYIADGCRFVGCTCGGSDFLSTIIIAFNI